MPRLFPCTSFKTVILYSHCFSTLSRRYWQRRKIKQEDEISGLRSGVEKDLSLLG